MIFNKLRQIMLCMALCAVFVAGLYGCTPKENVTKNMHAALSSATIGYNTAHELLTELKEKKSISKGNFLKAVGIMEKAELGIKAAGSAFEVYLKAATTENQDAFYVAVNTINLAINELNLFIIENLRDPAGAE